MSPSRWVALSLVLLSLVLAAAAIHHQRTPRTTLLQIMSRLRQDDGGNGGAGGEESQASSAASNGPQHCQQVAQSPPKFAAVKNIPPVLIAEVKQFACSVETSCQATSQDNSQIFGDCLRAAVKKAGFMETSYIDYNTYVDEATKSSASQSAINYVNTQVTADIFTAFKKLKDRFDDTCADQYKNCRRDAAKFTHEFLKLLHPAAATGIEAPKTESDVCSKPDVDPVFMAEFPNVEHHTRLFKHDIRKSCKSKLPNRLDRLQEEFRCINNEFGKSFRWCCPYWVVMQRKEVNEFDQYFRDGSALKQTVDSQAISLIESAAVPTTDLTIPKATSAENDRKLLLEKLQEVFDLMCEQKAQTNKERAQCVGKACTYVVEGLHRVLRGISEQVKDAAALGRDHPLNNQE